MSKYVVRFEDENIKVHQIIEALKVLKTHIVITSETTCDTCGGSGVDPKESYLYCEDCMGEGRNPISNTVPVKKYYPRTNAYSIDTNNTNQNVVDLFPSDEPKGMVCEKCGFYHIC